MQAQGNRIMDAILTYVEQDVRYRIGNPLGSQNDPQTDLLKTSFYNDLLMHFKKGLTPQEKATRKYLENELRKLSVKTNPTVLNRLINGRPTRWVRNLLSGNLGSINRQESMVHHYQNKIGLEQNMAQLTDAVKRAGFTQNIDHVLKKMLNQGLPRFPIRYVDLRHPNTDFILHFNNIPGTGAYQLERFDVAHRPANIHAAYDQPQEWLRFPISSETTLTASQAAKLAEGKAICKDEYSNLWIIPDKTNPTGSLQTVQFNLEEKLKELPLQKKGMQEFNNLLRKLRAGAAKEVVLNIGGKQENCQLIAAPLHQSVWILDREGKLIDKDSLLGKSNKHTEKLAKLVNQDKTKVVEMDFTKGRRV